MSYLCVTSGIYIYVYGLRNIVFFVFFTKNIEILLQVFADVIIMGNIDKSIT